MFSAYQAGMFCCAESLALGPCADIIAYSGNPGLGKSSFVERFAQYMLNVAHMRKVTKMRQITGVFNAELSDSCLIIVEELDFSGTKQDYMRELQELVSAAIVRGEGKNKDAGMRMDHNRYIAIVNVRDPVVLPPHQRRLLLLRFCGVMTLKMDRDPIFRENYLRDYHAAIEDPGTWHAYAEYLYDNYASDAEKMQRLKTEIHTKRFFNKETTQIQLASLSCFREWSIVGWLFRFLSLLQSPVGEQTERFVYRAPGSRSTEFWTWPCWATENVAEREHARRFKDCSWHACSESDADGWWLKAPLDAFYTSYENSLPSQVKQSARLSQIEFVPELKRLFDDTPVLEHMEVRPRIVEVKRPDGSVTTRTNGNDSILWLCIAPLPELKKAVAKMLPNSWGFTWEQYAAVRNAAS